MGDPTVSEQSSGLRALIRVVDGINNTVGTAASWLALFLVLVQFLLVLMRYVFGVASLFVQESLVYAHGTLFMLAAGYTLLTNGHVRVDVFYRPASAIGKAKVDLFGSLLLLLPVCICIFWSSFGYVVESWRVLEGSRETSGIQGIFLLKTVIWAFAILVALQGLSLGAKAWLTLTGRAPPEEFYPEISIVEQELGHPVQGQ